MEGPRQVVHGLPYRTEIDGLRAVAVLAVVLFHARLGCPGGFVGVDVFFVLSGFLITSLILRDLESSKFQLVDFWERRVRRIAPALTVWVAVTLAAGWFLYLPDDYARAGQSVVAQGLVLSNIYHGWKIDYFTPATEAFPLLHTWSLAVEEQFYIVLPLVLMGIRRWMPGRLLMILTVTGIVSFGLAVWLTATYPRVSFWILPTRAWELMLGSILAACPRWGSTASRGIREVASWVGLVAILVSISWFDEKVPFPGVATLLPTLGTFAFIWANAAGRTSSGAVMAWAPLVFIGKISYSYYLIHWPVIAYADYWYRDEMTWPVRLGLMLAAGLLAVVSLYVVETPIRKGQILAARRPLFVTTIVTTVALMIAGFWGYREQGVRSRFDAAAQKFLPSDRMTQFPVTAMKTPDIEKGKLCEFGDPTGKLTCLAWGDSHAMAMMPVLDDLCHEHGLKGLAAMYSNTPPLVGYVCPKWLGLGPNSPRFNAAVMKQALERRVQMVVMTGSWSKYADDPQFGPSLEATVAQLTQAGTRVVIVRDVPIHTSYVPRLLIRAKFWGQDVSRVGVPVEVHRQKNKAADEWLTKMAGPLVTVLDPTGFLSDQTGLCRAELGGYAMYRDAGHLSDEGARQLKTMYEPVFQEISQQAKAVSAH